MKAGTTTLFDLLSRHPGIAPARIKEPNFFAPAVGPIKTHADYASLFDTNSQQVKL